MYRGWFTSREREIIHTLLLQRGITHYTFVEANEEGRTLVGSAFDDEIALLCATIETPTRQCRFWLDRREEQYVLKYWHEEPPVSISVPVSG